MYYAQLLYGKFTMIDERMRAGDAVSNSAVQVILRGQQRTKETPGEANFKVHIVPSFVPFDADRSEHIYF